VKLDGITYKRKRLGIAHDICWDHASSPKVLQKETASAEAART
jgi:hypothetical protein